MDTLINIVTDYVREKMDTGTSWYDWPFDANKVPQGVLVGSVEGGDWYARNVDLKQRLNKTWQVFPERRLELERYYIADWGGVRGNRAETLARYHSATAAENIANGDVGIASWSKALCVRDPLAFAIFDARVSASLNALQVIHAARIAQPVRFPLLASRHGTVRNGGRRLTRYFQDRAWPAKLDTFYTNYLSLCVSVATDAGKPESPLPLYTVEMLLFAHAEELLRQAFPEL
jgi:hypothetical protein